MTTTEQDVFAPPTGQPVSTAKPIATLTDDELLDQFHQMILRTQEAINVCDLTAITVIRRAIIPVVDALVDRGIDPSTYIERYYPSNMDIPTMFAAIEAFVVLL